MAPATSLLQKSVEQQLLRYHVSELSRMRQLQHTMMDKKKFENQSAWKGLSQMALKKNLHHHNLRR